MDDNIKTEKWTLDDGRRAERRVTEQKTEDGQAERVIELHVEDERPLKLQQRVVEKSKPIVYERKIETLDPKTGSVLDQKVESIEPRVQMQLVEHIASASTVAAQSVQEDCDCHVTKEEMIDTIVAAIKATQAQAPAPVQPQKSFTGRLNTLGLADEIAAKTDATGMSNMDKVLMVVIAAQIIGLGYIIFYM